MTQPLRPAMDQNEWQFLREHSNTDQRHLTITQADGHRESLVVPPRFLGRLNHAVAAACLEGQVFGFTRQDLRDLLDSASMLEGAGSLDYPLRLKALSTRIAALLPPE